MLQLQPIRQILGYKMATNNETTMEITIRRVGMEDHINIVKLFQVRDLFYFQFVPYNTQLLSILVHKVIFIKKLRMVFFDPKLVVLDTHCP